MRVFVKILIYLGTFLVFAVVQLFLQAQFGTQFGWLAVFLLTAILPRFLCHKFDDWYSVRHMFDGKDQSSK